MSYTNEFYQIGKKAGFIKPLTPNTPFTVRYDILKSDMLESFGVRISSKYFAFLAHLDANNKVIEAWAANSGSNLDNFDKIARKRGLKLTIQEYYDKCVLLTIPRYIQE
jgi:hypothetical protein